MHLLRWLFAADRFLLRLSLGLPGREEAVRQIAVGRKAVNQVGLVLTDDLEFQTLSCLYIREIDKLIVMELTGRTKE